MGKSSRRSKKNGVDDAMTVAPSGGSSGGGDGWVYAGGEGSVPMSEALEGGDVLAAPAPCKKALTAGLRMKKKSPTVLRGITKRKNKRIAKAIAHAERKVVKQKKNTAKIGIRQEGKALY